jgi:hypothetical protein
VRRRLIVEYMKKEGGRFFMKDEQGRYFEEMNTQAVEQLELPVREFVAIRKRKFFLGEEVGQPPPC